MAKTYTAPFSQTLKTGTAVATTAFTLTGAGSMLDANPSNTQLLVTAGADGALVTKVVCIPRATSTLHKAALFISKDSGTTKHFVCDVAVAAHTMATTTTTPENQFPYISENLPLRLEAGDRLYVGIAVTQASGIVFHAQYTDF